MKIFIDAGHNYSGRDTGASGFGLREEVVSFEIADQLRRLLENAGHVIKMSRNSATDNVGDSVSDSINGRVNMANRWGADLFLSIHCNAGGGEGTETLVYCKEGRAAAFAERIQDAVIKCLETKDRGVKARPDLGVLKLTKCTAVLVETAFIDHESDAWLLKNRVEQFAQAIFEGVTGMKEAQELTDIHDIVWEYGHRGIVDDMVGLEKEMRKDPNGRLYWLARKALQFIRERNF